MINTLLVTFAVFTLSFFGLAVGWLVAEKKLKGSCGGFGGDSCVCETPCENKKKRDAARG